jgi:endonuclease YncB( thermonuclease family)
VIGKHQSGSTIGDVILQDGQELNKELVKEGLAWWDRKQSTNQSLGQLEDVARAEKRGLWADPHPVPPWEWKKQRHR